MGDYFCSQGEFEKALRPYYLVSKWTSRKLSHSSTTKYDAVKKTLKLFYDEPVVDPETSWLFNNGGIKVLPITTYKMLFDKLDKEPNLSAFSTMMVAVSKNTADSAPFMAHICTALTYFKTHATKFEQTVKSTAATLFTIMFQNNLENMEEAQEMEAEEEGEFEEGYEGGGYTENVANAVATYATDAASRISKALTSFDIHRVYHELDEMGLDIDVLVNTLVSSIFSQNIVAIYSTLDKAGMATDVGKMDNLEASLRIHTSINESLKNLPDVKAAVWPGKIEAPGFGTTMYPSTLTSLFTKEPKLTNTSTVYCVVNMSLMPDTDLAGLSVFYNKYQDGSPLTCDERTREIDLLTKIKYPRLHKAAENLSKQSPAVGAEVGHQRVGR